MDSKIFHLPVLMILLFISKSATCQELTKLCPNNCEQDSLIYLTIEKKINAITYVGNSRNSHSTLLGFGETGTEDYISERVFETFPSLLKSDFCSLLLFIEIFDNMLSYGLELNFSNSNTYLQRQKYWLVYRMYTEHIFDTHNNEIDFENLIDQVLKHQILKNPKSVKGILLGKFKSFNKNEYFKIIYEDHSKMNLLMDTMKIDKD